MNKKQETWIFKGETGGLKDLSMNEGFWELSARWLAAIYTEIKKLLASSSQKLLKT